MFFYKINVNNKVINPIEVKTHKQFKLSNSDFELKSVIFHKPYKNLWQAQSHLVRALAVLLYKKIQLDGMPSDMDKMDFERFEQVLCLVSRWANDPEDKIDEAWLSGEYQFLSEFASEYFDITAILNIQ